MSDEEKQVDQPESEGGSDEQPTGDFIEKAKYDHVLKESIGRKKKIKDLEGRLSELEAATSKSKDLNVELERFKKTLSDKEKEISRLTHLGTIKNRLATLGAIDPQVAELAYAAAEREDALDSELDDFLEGWKEKNKAFFKSEPVATVPKTPDKPTAEAPPATPTPESKWENFKNMSQSERMKLSPAEYEEYKRIGIQIAGNTFRPNE